MDDQLKSLSKLFSETLFRIPDFQRGYAWQSKEITDFWNDLLRLGENKKHYVGVLTLDPVFPEDSDKWIEDSWLIKSKDYAVHYVVDGQQRLTTCIILVSAIIEIMLEKKIDLLNYMTVEQIRTKYLFEFKPENQSKSFLFGYETDNPNYGFLADQVLDRRTKKSVVAPTLYAKNIHDATEFFMNKLRSLSKCELQIVMKKLTQDFLFNAYRISSEVDIHVAFESMNNRGRPLSNLERLKNRLIYLTSLMKISPADQARIRMRINNCWRTVYDQLGKLVDKRVQDDELLFAHYAMYFADSHLSEDESVGIRDCRSSDELLEKIFVPEAVERETISSTDLFAYVESLEKSAVLWNAIANPAQSEYSDEIKHYLTILPYAIGNARLYRFYELRMGNPQVLILALSVMSRADNDNILLGFLRALEQAVFLAMYYRLWIDRHVENTRFPDFTNFTTQLRKGEISINEVTIALKDWSNRIVSTDSYHKEIVSYYGEKEGYDREIDSYILYNYEFQLMTQSKTGKMRIDPDCLRSRVDGQSTSGIEHIFPVRSRNEYWSSRFSNFTDREKRLLKHSIGNLVVISDLKNQKLANKSFDEKKGSGSSRIGFLYGTFSEVEIAQYNDWNAESILNRGLLIISFIERRWGVRIGNKKDKIAFLGLSFLKSSTIQL